MAPTLTAAALVSFLIVALVPFVVGTMAALQVALADEPAQTHSKAGNLRPQAPRRQLDQVDSSTDRSRQCLER